MEDQQALVVDATPTIHLMARSAEEIQAANLSLLNWIDQRIAFATSDKTVLSENLKSAREHKWKTSGIQSALNRVQQSLTYYEKLKEAVSAGYTIIPNLPMNAFVVRVKQGSQCPKNEVVGKYKFSDDNGSDEIQPAALPAGEGANVCSDADRRIVKVTEEEYRFFNRPEFKEVEFPVTLVRPEVLSATQQAMARKVFDSIGIVDGNNKRSDPMIIGQIVGPRQGYSGRKTISFLIAWFIDARSI